MDISTKAGSRAQKLMESSGTSQDPAQGGLKRHLPGLSVHYLKFRLLVNRKIHGAGDKTELFASWCSSFAFSIRARP